MHGRNGPAVTGGFKMSDAGAGLYADIGMLQGRSERGGFGIHLAIEAVGVRIPGRLASGEPLFDIDPKRK
jgi:hypothetical protein